MPVTRTSRFKISVVIPVYNRPQLLSRALDSVISQTYQPFEIIVVDDGSDKDLSHFIMQHYPGVFFLRQKHAGVSRARNAGVASSKGSWIAFLDCDDQWLPAKLEEQVICLEKNTDMLLSHTNEIWIRNGVRVNAHNKHQKFGGNIFEKCLPRCLISPSSVLMSKDLFNEAGCFDEQLPACEDYDLWLKITSQYTIDYIDKPLIIKAGGHADQLSTKYWGMDRFRIYAMENILKSDCLSIAQQLTTVDELIKKCRIFAKGACKRGNIQNYKVYASKRTRYELLRKQILDMSQFDKQTV